MRYSGSEKLEIIKLVEQSTLSVCRTLASIGIPRSTFYDWYSRYQDGGIEALEDGRPRPLRVCAVTRRRFPVGASPHPATAPAGSNRSSHGGNEVAEASG